MLRPCIVILLCVLAGRVCIAQDSAAPAASDADSVENRLRSELADTRAELAKVLREIEQLKAFAAEQDADQAIEQLRKQTEAMEAERKKMQEQRELLEDARTRLLQASRDKRRELQAGGPAAEELKYDLDYTLSYIRIGPDRQTVYVEFGDLLVPAESSPNIDRSRVMIRGTLQNVTAEPLRYTFEARIVDRYNRLIGRWRYQTPVLEPEELHEFDFEVPVLDAARVAAYRIGNITFDRPAPQRKKEEAAKGKEENPPAKAAEPNGKLQKPAEPQLRPEQRLR